MTTIKIDNRYMPELCVSADATRHTITQVYCDSKNSTIVATDGRMMVTVPCEIEGALEDAEGIIPVDAFKAARKLQKSFSVLTFQATKTAITVLASGDIKQEFKRADCQYPNYKQVLPVERADRVISFDANLLLTIAKALKNTGKAKGAKQIIELSIPRDENDLSALVIKSDYAKGILMPCRVRAQVTQ